MAGLKKAPKRRDNTNPNTVLVVFLVLFVLLSIGLGVAMYYGYAGQDELKKAAVAKAKEVEEFKNAARYGLFVSREIRQALGDTLDADELEAWKTDRENVIKEAGPHKDEKTREAVLKTMISLKAQLGFDEQAGKYLSTFKDKTEKLNAELARVKGESDAAVRARKAADEKFATLNTKHEAFYGTTLKSIEEGSQKAFKEARSQAQVMKEAIEQNTKLRNEITKIQDDFLAEKRQLELDKNQLALKIQELTRAEKEAAVANPRGGKDPHALFLDISGGKPLWDSPLGKITRVEQNRQVVINLGSGDGVRPELTFSVFAANKNNRADGTLKGTLEVVRVLDANTSVARVTAQYDSDGHEIPLNETGGTRVQREASNPIKEGDLLFNMFWGSHIAIAGRVRWQDYEGESPAEQMRSLNQFMQLLQRQGIVVDAYLDLTDGTIKGAITARTRYLLLGEELAGRPIDLAQNGGDKAAEKPAPDKEGADKENKVEAKEEEKAPEGGAKAVGQERVKMVDDRRGVMRNEAVERGMFIISPQNFAIVTGYRPPRSATRSLATGFEPSLPSASNLGILRQPVAAPAAPAPEKQ